MAVICLGFATKSLTNLEEKIVDLINLIIDIQRGVYDKRKTHLAGFCAPNRPSFSAPNRENGKIPPLSSANGGFLAARRVRDIFRSNLYAQGHWTRAVFFVTDFNTRAPLPLTASRSSKRSVALSRSTMFSPATGTSTCVRTGSRLSSARPRRRASTSSASSPPSSCGPR